MTNENLITTSPPQDQPMIALYYWYINIPAESLSDQVTFHESLCKDLNLFGRIRISTEGLNGVLSGTVPQLKTYEEKIRHENEQKFRPLEGEDVHVDEQHCVVDGNDGDSSGDNNSLEYGQTLDVKYCHLRKDIPFEKQLFDSLSVKITKEVVSLNEGPVVVTDGNNKTDIIINDPTKQQKATKHNQNNSNQPKKKKRSRKKNKGDRYEQIMEEDRRRKEQQRREKEEEEEKQRQLKLQESSNPSTTTSTTSCDQLEKEALSKIDQYQPATHLSPKEWNEHLLNEQQQQHTNNDENNNTNNNSSTTNSNAILIDARNIYESKIGYFTSKNVPTLLTNTRKYSTITSVFNQSIEHLAGKNVYMYCTGGVRCERASVYLQALANSDAWPEGLERPKSIYQLEGGIQKYLEQYGHLEKKKEKTEDDTNPHGEKASSVDECITKNEMNKVDLSPQNPIQDQTNAKSEEINKCLFRGKNFVFDPRRYDPIVGNDETPVGQCVLCSNPFDDYDNNHAPCENMEARCCRCRVLILVCNGCRLKVRVWGQEKGGSGDCPDVFCGPDGKHCIDEGNSVGHCVIVNN